MKYGMIKKTTRRAGTPKTRKPKSVSVKGRTLRMASY